MSAAVAAFDPTRSPMGDERHRPIRCFHCGTFTWNWLGYCTADLNEAPLRNCPVCEHVPTPAGQPCSGCAAFDNGGDRG